MNYGGEHNYNYGILPESPKPCLNESLACHPSRTFLDPLKLAGERAEAAGLSLPSRWRTHAKTN